MKRTVFTGIALSALTSALSAVAQTESALPDTWSNWRWFRSVEQQSVDSRLVKVSLPPEVYGHSDVDLRDIRVIDEAGTEVAYVVDMRPGRETTETSRVDLLEVSHVPGAYTQALLDLGGSQRRHNQVELILDATSSDFIGVADVAASDDEKQWRTLRDSQPVYRFRQQGTHLTIDYGDTTARWLRIRVRDEQNRNRTKLPLTAVQASFRVVEQPERVELPGRSMPVPQESGQSWWQLDLGSTGVPVTQVHFEVETPVFQRSVEILTSDDNKTWRQAGGDYISRGPAEGTSQSSRLTATFPETNGRYWRIIVANQNDSPLEGVQVTLLGVPRHVVFEQEPNHRYRILYGNESAQLALYDLSQTLSKQQMTDAPKLQLGDEQGNATWTDPRPFSEKNPVLLWSVLLIAVVVLAGLALRSLRQPRLPQP